MAKHVTVLKDNSPTGEVELLCECGWAGWARTVEEAERKAEEHKEWPP